MSLLLLLQGCKDRSEASLAEVDREIRKGEAAAHAAALQAFGKVGPT